MSIENEGGSARFKGGGERVSGLDEARTARQES